MKTDSGLHPNILAIRERLAKGRERLRAQHDAGSPGIQVCTRMTDLIDTLVLEIYESVIRELGPRGKELEGKIALVPHGGFGRRDVAPYSDVDLMLLHRHGIQDEVQPLAKLLSQYIVDAGMTLGFSTRTPAQACSMAFKDVKIHTSLIESRYLTGSVRLFSKFFSKFKTDTSRRADRMIEDISVARRSERSRFGESVYLLKPNVKRSRGALREIQLFRWIGFVRHGESSPTTLMRMDLMSPDDRNLLRRAKEFLLRTRNELHFHAGKEQDILDRSEQFRIAKKFGYEGSEAILPVEGLMRDYFNFTGEVRYRVSNFVATSRNKSVISTFFGRLFAHKVGGDYLVGPVHIAATKTGIAKLKTDLTEILRLMKMALLYDRRVEHDTWMEIRQAMTSEKELPLSDEAREEFLSLMGQPGRLGSILRRLHQLRVLERIIPSMSHARCLLQFNEYHKYTVDEHSIRTVENVTDTIHDPGPLGDAYRSLRDKRVLHLAALIHDLGKGFTEDHSVVGAELSLETSAVLGLNSRETETLRFLVYRHLLMSHLAQRRDINDPEVVFQFAAEVGSPDVLKMLFVLTCADIGAVGPGTFNDWKKELLTELYHRTMRQISDDSPSMTQKAQLQRRREKMLDQLGPDGEDPWWQEQVGAMPPNCLYYADSERLLEQIGELKELEKGNAIAWGRYIPERNVTEYTVGTHESISPGLFYTLTGSVSSKQLQILSAEINTLAHGLVLDRFYVHDSNQKGEPSVDRIDDVARDLVKALRFPEDNKPNFSKKWGELEDDDGEALPRMPTQVKIDNTTAEQHTIIDIFANDQLGLLYVITRTLFALELSVCLAKIGTYLDQVVDVFYVTDLNGNKLVDDAQLDRIREELLKAIDEEA
jgi:[protein-PII] uridylyltransferase